MPSGFASRSSGGRTAAGAFCQATGRRKRRIAVIPTEVCAGADVAGYGPPWCMPWVTATPVGKPSNTTRPARSAIRSVSVAEQLRVLLRLGVDRARELALELRERGQQLVAVAIAEQHDDRAEVLLEHRRPRGDRRGRRLVGGGLVAEAVAGERRRAAERADVVLPGQAVDRGGERVAEPLVEQHGRLDAVELGGDGLRERVAGRAGRDEDDAGLRAQLAAEVGHGRDEPVGDRLRAGGERGVGDDDRVDRAHLGVDGDRLRPARRAVGDRAPAGGGAGEADGGDRRRVDERLADLDAGGEQVRDRSVGQPGVGGRAAQLARRRARPSPGATGGP